MIGVLLADRIALKVCCACEEKLDESILDPRQIGIDAVKNYPNA
jgi:hypothetical protein